jgi:Bacterial regulatory proteins, gntR family
MRLVRNAGADLRDEYEQLERSRWYRQTERPQLNAALAACKAQGATLIIARLGHMASSAPFLSQLVASRVPFVACDRPDVNPLTIRNLAIAAQTRKTAKIEKIKQQRAAGTLRQQPIATPEGKRRSAETKRQLARDFAAYMAPFLQAARRKGSTHKEVAAELNAIGVKTRRGLKWDKQTVGRALRSAGSLTPSTLQVDAAAKLIEDVAAKQNESSRAASAPPIMHLRADAISAPATPVSAQPAKKKRGPPPVLRQAIIARMRAEISEGTLTAEQLDRFDEEALAARYKASRHTVREARRAVLSL